MMIHKIDVFFEENLLKNVVEMLTIKFSKKERVPPDKIFVSMNEKCNMDACSNQNRNVKRFEKFIDFRNCNRLPSEDFDLYVKLT